jgi:digeranylgeranylglycerophospholipid reductase
LSSSELYDVAIVGSSYSGLMAGITASKSCKVLLIEKRKKPGSPVNSTGAVPIEWLHNMDVFPSSDCIAGNIRGIELIAPNDESAVIKNDVPDGMVLYPDKYVNWMANRARDKGCEIKTETVFRGLSTENGHGSKGNEGKPTTISTTKGDFRARYVIGADGAWTAVGQATGLAVLPKPEDLHIGLEYHVENHHVQDPEIYRLWLGHELAPLGYAWSFPEGNDSLKVGVGIPKSEGIAPTKLMDKFFKRYPQYKTTISSSNGGNIPTAPPLKTAVKGNIMLVGDAAHFCSPLHGGGIWFGMDSGQMAGTAVIKNDAALYDKLWKEELGGVLQRHYKLKMVIYSMTDKNFNDLISVLKIYANAKDSKMGKAGTARRVLFSDPRFIMLMMLKWTDKGLGVDVLKRILMPNYRIA